MTYDGAPQSPVEDPAFFTLLRFLISYSVGRVMLISTSTEEYAASKEHDLPPQLKQKGIRRRVYILAIICYAILYWVLLQRTFCPLHSTNYWKSYTLPIAILFIAEEKLGLEQLAQGSTFAPGKTLSRGTWV